MLKLCIDPGHGGKHTGGTVPELIEAEYVYARACELSQWIGCVAGGAVDVTMLRDENETVDLRTRGRRSGKAGADLVLSLHVNAAPDADSAWHLRGAMCFHWPGNEIGMRIGDAILRAMPPPLLIDGRGSIAAISDGTPKTKWLQRPRAVLSPHAATTVLIEIGFMSHRVDLPALLEPTTQSAVVAALVCGVMRWQQIAE